MPPQFIDIVKQVTADLAAATFSEPITFTRTAARQIFAEELTDSPICFVRLSPSTPIASTESDVRSGRAIDVPVELAIAAKGRSTELNLFDRIVGLAEEIDEYLFESLAVVADAVLISSEIESAFSSQQLRDFGAVQASITATYRTEK